MQVNSDTSSASADIVRHVAREHEPDRYVAALLAPRAVRADLIAVAAFSGEIDRVPRLVREPMMGEIRLQWWRDALGRSEEGAHTGHPVADALRQTMRRHDLPPVLLAGIIDAHGRRLESGREPDFAATEGALFVLAWRILAGAQAGPAPSILLRAGQLYGRARRFPRPTAPAEDVETTADAAALRAEVGAASRKIRTALLPLALIEPYLRAQNRGGASPGAPVEIAPLTRAWRLWRAHRFGRF